MYQSLETLLANITTLIFVILSGFVLLTLGADCLADGASALAKRFGGSSLVIGMTVVAFVTSLPELATSVVAAFKKNCDLALGNIIGSVSFNVFFILGMSATVMPLPAYNGIMVDCVMVTLGALLIWLAVLTNRRHELNRWHGAILLALYAAYLTYRLMNC